MTERQLRGILYDHLFSRQAPLVDYDALPPEAQRGLVGTTSGARGRPSDPAE